MKRLLVLAAAVVAAASLGGTAAAAGRDAFAGVWIGVESPVGDGSTDVMRVGGPRADGSRQWSWYETYATFCGGGSLAAAGTATTAGNVLLVTVTSTSCANGSAGAFPPPFTLTMTTVGADRIDFGGVILTRLG